MTHDKHVLAAAKNIEDAYTYTLWPPCARRTSRTRSERREGGGGVFEIFGRASQLPFCLYTVNIFSVYSQKGFV